MVAAKSKSTPSRKRAPRVAPELRRELLLEAARRCLSQKGMKGFTLHNVAKEAGVSLALIGHYFGGAEELLKAVFDSVMFELPAVDREEPRNLAGAVANLRNVVNSNFAAGYYSRENLLIWLPIYEEMALNKKLRQKLAAKDQRYVDKVAAVIATVARFRRRKVDPQALAYEFLAFLDGLWLRWCHSERADTALEQDAAYRFLEAKLGPLRAA